MSQVPLVAFNYQVQWDGSRAGFAEVTGLNVDFDIIEYREGTDESSARKIPGKPKWSDISLKRGIISPDNHFFEWILNTLRGTPDRRDLTISLVDASGQPITTWKIRNAIAVGLHGPHLDATANEIAIEELIVAHEGFEVEMAN